MSLTALYGPCRSAFGDVHSAERDFRPESLQRLDEVTAPALRAYLAASPDVFLPAVVHQYCPLLWLIDRDGKVWFSVEELVDPVARKTIAMRPRGDWGKIPGTEKLGHPSLLHDATKEARIGGEIVYRKSERLWSINNGSGRYGMRSHQKKTHLEAAAARFKENDIVLVPDFFPVRRAT